MSPWWTSSSAKRAVWTWRSGSPAEPNAGRTRVVLISTHAEEDFVELIEASPAVGFLSKSKLSGRALRELLGGDDDDTPGPR